MIFWKTWRQFKPQVILFYDSLSILAYSLGTIFNASRPLLWYHNHDICDANVIRKYSLTWWSLGAEKWIFPKLSLFSLPAQERQQYFPMQKLRGKFVCLPNYPAKSFYRQFYQKRDYLAKDIVILYQGQLGPGHGIEEIVNMLPFAIDNKPVKLVLRGHARHRYDEWLKQAITEKSIEDFVSFEGFVPYKNIPFMGAQCHIGLAIFTKQDVMNKTLGTASNKIYEYAALGLPVLYYDSPHFREHLGTYAWAIPTDLSTNSLEKAITRIFENYGRLSELAHLDFCEKLNFENNFENVLSYLKPHF